MLKMLALLSMLSIAFSQSLFEKLEEKPSFDTFEKYFVEGVNHRELKKDDILVYIDAILRPYTSGGTGRVYIFGVGFPGSKAAKEFYSYRIKELVGRALQTEKAGNKELASEAYALLLVSLRYGAIFQNSLKTPLTELQVPGINALEPWLEEKVKSLKGERYYRRYLMLIYALYPDFLSYIDPNREPAEFSRINARLGDITKELEKFKNERR